MGRMRLGQEEGSLDLLRQLVIEKEQRERLITTYTGELADLQSQLAYLGDVIVARISEFRAEIAQLDQTLANLQTQINLVRTEIDAIRAELGI